MKKVYPSHIYEEFREQVATSYIKHEFRKLFWRVPKSYWELIDGDISEWMRSPMLTTPRDFWNGFHGICMGFRLKIGLIYFVTAENVSWERKNMPVTDLWFGVDLQQTKVVGEGKLSAKKVIEFYNSPGNRIIREKQLDFTLEISGGKAPRDEHPVIVVEKEKDQEFIYSTYDGNRRLVKAILEGKEQIEAFVGSFTKGKQPINYWIPTAILMENLLFARQAYDRGEKELFYKYMEVLRDMLNQSESAKYELENRALTSQQPFRDMVLKVLRV